MKKRFLIIFFISIFIIQASSCSDSGAGSGERSETPSAEYTLKLFFPDDDAMNLHEEVRIVELPGDGYGVAWDVMAKAIIDELAKGPGTEGLANGIPGSTMVKSISLDGGVLMIDFNKSFEEDNPGGSAGVSMAMGALAVSLTELNDVDAIKITIEGSGGDFKGHISLDEIITRDEFVNLIKQ